MSRLCGASIERGLTTTPADALEAAGLSEITTHKRTWVTEKSICAETERDALLKVGVGGPRWRSVRLPRTMPAIWRCGSPTARREWMGGITLGGIIVIIGIVVAIFWSFWLGLIIALIGLVAFGGFARGRWY
jgi:hypothetical protein